MDWDEIRKALLEKLKIPQTIDEAIKRLEEDEASQVIIEDMAWKQTVLNVLVAAKIVSEDDFNATVAHFKKVFTAQFAEKMLETIEAHKNNSLLDKKFSELDLDEDFDEPEVNEQEENIAKA